MRTCKQQTVSMRNARNSWMLSWLRLNKEFAAWPGDMGRVPAQRYHLVWHLCTLQVPCNLGQTKSCKVCIDPSRGAGPEVSFAPASLLGASGSQGGCLTLSCDDVSSPANSSEHSNDSMNTGLIHCNL